jgi:hypothetical protein
VTFDRKDQIHFEDKPTLDKINKELFHHSVLVLPGAVVECPVQLTNSTLPMSLD